MKLSLQDATPPSKVVSSCRMLRCSAEDCSRHTSETLGLLRQRSCALCNAMRTGVRGTVAALLVSALVFPYGASAAGSHPCPEHLLVIERSKNANIVVYDAKREPSSVLVASKPVV